MSTRRTVLPLLLIALAVPVSAAKKQPMDPALYAGRDGKEAAAALLERAERLAEDGSYELLAVARLYVLSGDRANGQRIIDRVLAGKAGPSEWIRVGRLHLEAGSWDDARPFFDRALEAKPEDEDWLAEIGGYYVAHGDRAHGESLIGRSFEEDPENVRNTLRAAAGYLGVAPD